MLSNIMSCWNTKKNLDQKNQDQARKAVEVAYALMLTEV